MSYYAPCATTQPFWVKDMMTHVQADRESEFSTSGSGDDVSVYWEPVSSFTDPFKTYSPTNTILPPPLSLKNLPTLPLSPTGSPGTQPLEWLLDTEASQEIESSVLTTVPANEEKWSHTYCTRHRGALLKQISSDNVVGVHIGQAEEGKEKKSMLAEASCVCGGVIRARACRTTSAGQPCKRKIEDADAEDDTNQEYRDKPVPKRIRREKTGTEWQTVVNITKYSEQRSEQSQMEGTKANV
ncbi:hypothetical protein EV702DRAFT_1050818 [Suillus placidus]|uniref:Uncharacterized protein n=1 Tax=Suillus placidus TaxID=48579 RepID=A0A9P6ZH71_9AGAM|nr:hypothetical protein EV702DRAFT_1050818 [Suillus placidus]